MTQELIEDTEDDEPVRPFTRTKGLLEQLPERVAKRLVINESGCWEWTGPKLKGYGQLGIGSKRDHSKRTTSSHRFVYTFFKGAVPDGLDLDHLCRNRACANPDHLEPVTRRENIRRGFAHLTHCPHGHPYDVINTRLGTRGERICRACRRIGEAERRRRIKAQKNSYVHANEVEG